MDVLDLRLEPAAFATGEELQVVPYVNGRSLLEIPVEAARTKAGPKRRAPVAARLGDGHAGIGVAAGAPPDLSGLRPGQQAHDAPVLGCACGVTGCSPVRATIAADGDAVTWSVAGREFRFDRRQYLRALDVSPPPA